jgi:RNA polymerase sigma factor (sigma-70 family)
MPPQDDHLRSLMIASLDGDKAAYRALLLALTPVVQGYLARRVRTGREDVEDLVQDTLMAIHARRITYDRTRALMPWVYAIAHHKFIDWMRRRRITSPLDEAGFEPAIDSFEDSSNAAFDTERLLATLPPKQAAAIRSTKLDELDVAEAAARHGLGESDVKVSVHRGLKALMKRVRGE